MGHAQGGGFFAQRFGIDRQTVERLLDTAMDRGGDYAELYFERRLSRAISYEEQRVKGTTSEVIQGLGVRVVSGEAIGYAYTEQLQPEQMRRAARTAARICAGARQIGPVRTTCREPARYYDLDRYSVDESAAAKVALLRRADEAARAYAPTVTRVTIDLKESRKHIAIASSDGVFVHDVQPYLSLGLQALSERHGDRQSAYAGRAGRVNLSFLEEVTPEAIGRDAARLAVQAHDAVDAPAGTFPVVLGPSEPGTLIHEAVGHGLEADFNRKRTSVYSDRVGQRVASPLVTVVDDGTIPYHGGTINVDDEGTPSQRTVLIERGVLAGYMHDWISARYFAVPRTGNARRQSFRVFPQPRMRMTYLAAGEDDPADIIRSVGRGVYCLNFSGGSVNSSTGDFVFSTTEAYLIEGGKITAPLKQTTLTGNGPELLTKVKMVGHDLRFTRGTWVCGKHGQSVPAAHGLPTVLVPELVVGGTQR